MKTLLKKWMSPKWEILLWVGVLAFVGYRFGPQVGAALGVGGEDTEVASDSGIQTLDGHIITMEDPIEFVPQHKSRGSPYWAFPVTRPTLRP